MRRGLVWKATQMLRSSRTSLTPQKHEQVALTTQARCKQTVHTSQSQFPLLLQRVRGNFSLQKPCQVVLQGAAAAELRTREEVLLEASLGPYFHCKLEHVKHLDRFGIAMQAIYTLLLQIIQLHRALKRMSSNKLTTKAQLSKSAGPHLPFSLSTCPIPSPPNL